MQRPRTTGDSPTIRPAGVRGGTGSMLLDAAMPLQGMARQRANKPAWSERQPGPETRSLENGDGGATLALNRDAEQMRMTGFMPSSETTKRLASLPGYGGHIEGKVAENIHGCTYKVENEQTLRTVDARDMRRTQSMTHTISSPMPLHVAKAMSDDNMRQSIRRHGATRGMDGNAPGVVSHIPGYMVHMPGKLSETVHAHSTGEVSLKSQALRKFNPHVNCESWLRKGMWPSDKRPLYKMVNRFMQTDSQHFFSRAQDEEYSVDNVRLGHTFGLCPQKPVEYKPGDRFVHSKLRNRTEDGGRKDPSLMAPAGQPTHSLLLEEERWRLHHTLAIRNGNQRNAY